MKLTIVLASALALTRIAAAKPAASAQAEALFNDAKKLMGEKKFAEACDKFETSQKLDPAITTLLNAADCREKNGQLATAWSLFVDVERQARTTAGAAKLGTIAHARAAKLEPRLSKLTIKLSPEASKLSGLKVMLGTEPVLPGTFGTALPMDGGKYTIAASASGLPGFSQTVDLAVEGDNKTVEIPKLGSGPTRVTPPSSGGTSAPSSGAVDEESTEGPTGEANEQPASGGRSRTVPILMTVAAVGLIGGGIAFELSGRSLLDESAREPDYAKQDGLYNKANVHHKLAQGFAIAGVAATGVAIYLWARGGKRSSSSSAMVVPTAGDGQVGLVITGGL